jgi:hypothetical protein
MNDGLPGDASASSTIASGRHDASATGSAPMIDASTPLPIARRRSCSSAGSQSACHMNELVTVEMQCVMQLLDAGSLLRFARCSRRLLSDADSDVAWKHQSAFDVQFTGDDLAVGDRIRRSLVRHAPVISVDWYGSDGEADSTDAEVSGLLRIPRMTHLRLAHRLSHAQYHQVLTHSGLDSLRELTIVNPWFDLPFGFIDQLVRLESFTSLRIDSDLPRLDPLTALPQLNLKKLKLYDRMREPLYTDVIGQCAHLTDLDITAPAFYGPRFRPFLTQLGPQLQRLTIRWFFAPRLEDTPVVIPVEDYIAAFQSLLQLRFLCLDSVYDVDDLLQHLHHAPVLQQLLVIRPRRFSLSTWPTVAVIQQLMNRTSAGLHIEVVPRKLSGFPSLTPSQQYAALDPARFTYREE